MYRITLRSVGNPDFGQDPHQPMSPTEEIMVDTLKQAAEAARAYIVRHVNAGDKMHRYAGVKMHQ